MLQNNFINVQYVKDFSSLDLNISDKLIVNSIKFSQDEYILNALGTALFNDLLSKTANSTLTGNDLTLVVNYVQPCLAAYTLYESAEFLIYKFSGKSIEKQTSDNSEPLSGSEFDRVKQKFLNRAQVYGTRLSNYLMANTNLFPLFNSPGNSFDTIFPDRTDSYRGGIFTSKKNKNRFFGYDFPEDQHPLN